MTNNIYPPDHLLRKWEELIIDEEQNVDVVLYEAFQAGADQELEACCMWLSREVCDGWGLRQQLRAARRPKPPSLKEQALEALDQADKGLNESEWQQRSDTIRRALEALPE